MRLVIPCASSLSFSALPLFPHLSFSVIPLPFKFLLEFLTCWLGITSSVLLLHSSTIALRLFLSRGTAAVPGEGRSQPGHSHSQCFLAHFTHVVTEKSGSLCYMQITYAHACARAIGRQVITCREEWGFISVPVEGDGPEHPRALEGFNNSS